MTNTRWTCACSHRERNGHAHVVGQDDQGIGGIDQPIRIDVAAIHGTELRCVQVSIGGQDNQSIGGVHGTIAIYIAQNAGLRGEVRCNGLVRVHRHLAGVSAGAVVTPVFAAYPVFAAADNSTTVPDEPISTMHNPAVYERPRGPATRSRKGDSRTREIAAAQDGKRIGPGLPGLDADAADVEVAISGTVP
jgi:hypothetical protein